MRRPIFAAVLTVAAALSAIPPGAAEAAPTAPAARRGAAVAVGARLPDTSSPHARAALARAQQVLAGTAAPAPGSTAGSTPDRIEGTLAMRDLFAALPGLSGGDRRQARAVLARPTNGSNDIYGDGYRTKAKHRCAGHFCIHWVTRTSDRASNAWVTRTLRTMNDVWRLEVGELGYRRPVRDGHHGGNNKFDVYLKDVGANYLYGYCAPEYLKPHHEREASGYCVLDNDFARSQFRARPVDSLRVTAAHEFFHAVQFAYDYQEDQWLMEATATWMEERFADGVNDNRQYLKYGQVNRPAGPLDYFDPQGFNQYGNWPFFEYLSSHYGLKTVRQIWQKAAEAPDRRGGGLYSTQAVDAVLARRGGFPEVFTAYAAGNVESGRTYAEGRHWPKAAITRTWTLQQDAPTAQHTFTVRHMASRNAVLKPGSSLDGAGWQGTITIDGPVADSQPRAYVVIRRTHGKDIREAIPLDASGHGELTFPFGTQNVHRVALSLVNASTRFDCQQQTTYSCSGDPVDDHDQFDVTVSAVPGS